MHQMPPKNLRLTMTSAERHSRIHLAELSAIKRVDAAAPQQSRIRSQRLLPVIPKLRLLLHLD
jgi:hypothetical protein